ncbi:3-hydroxyacyl-ACP dehydratase FabZ [Acinetobacter qingfengensis]|uniref:3-hydroxyacyl-[acyl-carrier-protein] dehydratase FabZ n=1 Tax=Acinetobacter qingfengensis TaxID=1262585 RepID=A0A1E7RE40_9GAMM|nr:3-hydroxyacyl-ACP dehydratase FabZ [Acinetobacter qingfengensis]KAA8734383.1 3-hydroxyacyl-ACP dehydratase FabZ [Acinetobacter qingfengensis]OEY97608.1 3-hydroxyacyl-[acyl-carrier-protein] dehydratase FabZ [Acinetobacter qingfengensis]
MTDIQTQDDLIIPQLPMNIQKIREYLPHAYPFLLVDRVTAIENATKIQGYKNVSMNEEFFQGHFPAYPIMPGVLIMEALAQLSGILGMMIINKKPQDGDTFLFAGMENVRFKKQVVPGDQLVLNSELILNRRGVFKFNATACVDDKVVAQAEIILSRQTLSL